MERRSANGQVDATRARLFGKRVALVSCGAVAAWFIVASVAQLIPPAFGTRIVPLAGPEQGSSGSSGASTSPEWRCAEGLRRATAAAGATVTPAGASVPAGPRPGLDSEALAACSETSAGLDALAAYRRLELAEGKLGSSDPGSVEELRRELSAHLPAQMR
jgi:hypothetical protein